MSLNGNIYFPREYYVKDFFFSKSYKGRKIPNSVKARLVHEIMYVKQYEEYNQTSKKR